MFNFITNPRFFSNQSKKHLLIILMSLEPFHFGAVKVSTVN